VEAVLPKAIRVTRVVGARRGVRPASPPVPEIRYCESILKYYRLIVKNTIKELASQEEDILLSVSVISKQ